MVYELVAGKPPYTGTSTNDLLNKHLRAPIPPLQAANRNVTRRVFATAAQSIGQRTRGAAAIDDRFSTNCAAAQVFKTPPAPV